MYIYGIVSRKITVHTAIYSVHIRWVGQNHICTVYKVFLAGKSSNIRSYTVYIYGSGQPYLLLYLDVHKPSGKTLQAEGRWKMHCVLCMGYMCVWVGHCFAETCRVLGSPASKNHWHAHAPVCALACFVRRVLGRTLGLGPQWIRNTMD